MIILYAKEDCAYKQMVVHVLEDFGLEYKELNMSDPRIADELLARGGKLQSPYLIDESTGMELYESGDIVSYLHKQYGGDNGGAD